MKFNRIVLSALLVLGSAALYGCGGDDEDTSSPTTCNEDPTICSEGTTCWANASFHAQCLASGSAQDGQACQGLAGQAECGDGLWCGPSSTGESGICTPFCNPDDGANACPNGRPCLNAALQNTQTKETIAFTVCQPLEEATGMGGADG